jgi:hypothetical protein
MLLDPVVPAPDVPLVALLVALDGLELALAELPVFALVSMKRSLALELPVVPEVAVPDVPVAPLELDDCRQPVTVIEVAVLLCRELLDWDEDVWALTPPVNASASAATPPIHTLLFILSLLVMSGGSKRANRSPLRERRAGRNLHCYRTQPFPIRAVTTSSSTARAAR